MDGRISRRTLLKAGLFMATTPGAATAAPSPVFLVRTTDRAAGIRRGLAALGMPAVRGKRVVIKPNFNSADPYPASTHPETLRLLVAHLQAAGAGGVTIAERSGMGSTRRVMERLGTPALAQELGFGAVVLDETPMEGWIEERLNGSHWKRGVLFPRIFRDADHVVQTCCLKTHRYGGHFTLSLKNSVGMVAKHSPRDGYNYMEELHGSPYQRRMIAEINQLYRPSLVVLDGLEGFSDGGPDQGTLVKPGVLLLGSDRVAIDAVGVALLRLHGGNRTISAGRVFDQEQIARAAELGLGARGPEQIELVTDDPESRAVAGRVREVLFRG
jgi:uncharacterized protein (DUF362 family)